MIFIRPLGYAKLAQEWPRSSRALLAKALSVWSALNALRLSCVRREVLPSMAMRSCRSGQSSLIQLSKHCPNRTGFDAIDQAPEPAHAGDAEMKLREPSQKIEMLLAPCHDVLEVVA